MTRPNYWVIIPAAGIGQRFTASIPKQYALLHGKSIIEHTIAKFLYHPSIKKIVVVVDAHDHHWQRLQSTFCSDKIMSIAGGAFRCQSVFSGLQQLKPFVNTQDFVLIHDAVRPFITHYDIDKLIEQVGTHPVGGILGTKVRDTLKFSNDRNEIVNTLSRENVWQALTPQMFRYQLLFHALQENIAQGNMVSDEASAIETLGLVPMIIEGRRDNIKITFAEDLLLAEKYVINELSTE